MAIQSLYGVPALEQHFSLRLGTTIRLRVERFENCDGNEDDWELRLCAHGLSRGILGGMMSRANQGSVFRARRLRFPQRACSISHCAETIICATSTDRWIGGLGVDLEVDRAIPRSADRLYLTARERGSLRSGSTYSNADLLRLWTVKEALFKADVENRMRGWLSCYECLDPCRLSGKARLRSSVADKRFKFASLPFLSGFLTVAISEERRVP